VRIHAVVGALVILGSSACVSMAPTSGSPTPADIPRLEAAVAADATDASALASLGAAYRAAGRTDDAIARLERSLELRPDDPAATLYLGLAYEDADDPERARAQYERYLAIGGSARIEDELRRRIDLLTREAIVARARALAAGEASFTAEPEPRTVAVFPFVYVGTDPQYRPLERAMAELLVTDLAQTDRLTVLERLQVQALIDELGMAETGRVDPATAARSGRLLRASQVVQGSIAIDPTTLELSAAVVGATGEPTPTAPITEASLDRLFEAETQLALALYESLGIELTVAERQRVEQRPTSNIQALLAWGEGLEAEDRGDFEAAASHYQRAAQIDPGFDLAIDRSTLVLGIVQAETQGLAGIGQQATIDLTTTSPTTSFGATQTLPPSVPSLDAVTNMTGDPMRRDAVAEALNVEGIALRTVLRIVFRRPGATP
jgi:tetratricopeptide (TPR) repeat protein